MKLTRCDICGKTDVGGFMRIEVPEMAGICSVGLRSYDVCPACAVRIAVKVHEVKVERRRGKDDE